MAELKEEEKNNFPEVKSTQNKIKLMITSTQHHHPYDEKISNRYTLSLTQLFGLIHFTTWAVLVVFPLQQWLLNILFHVCERITPLVSLRSLFPTLCCMHHSKPRKQKIITKDAKLFCFEAQNGEKNKGRGNKRTQNQREKLLDFSLV